MTSNENSHRNRQLSPFNRGFYSPKNMSAQVNGHTQMSQREIINRIDAVTRYRK